MLPPFMYERIFEPSQKFFDETLRDLPASSIISISITAYLAFECIKELLVDDAKHTKPVIERDGITIAQSYPENFSVNDYISICVAAEIGEPTEMSE